MRIKKTNKILRNIENGATFQIYSSHCNSLGVKMVDFMGVTSGQVLIDLEQINMKYFEIIEKEGK